MNLKFNFLKYLIVIFGIYIISGCEKDSDINANKLLDVDGNIYNTITIGSQVWMAENLKTTKYNDGTAIPLLTDITAWQTPNNAGYCWYNNDSSTNAHIYGALYNWHTVKSEKLCPSGWHVPTDEEWTILTDYLGGSNIAGGKLKETDTMHWNSPNSGATNETNFGALPGGYRFGSGTFFAIGEKGYWWTSSKKTLEVVLSRNMSYDYSDIHKNAGYMNNGLSVRCVRD